MTPHLISSAIILAGIYLAFYVGYLNGRKAAPANPVIVNRSVRLSVADMTDAEVNDLINRIAESVDDQIADAELLLRATKHRPPPS